MYNLLMVTFCIPPVNNPGALRAAKFARYLPEFGWQPTVLAALTQQNQDPALLQELPPGIVEKVAVSYPRGFWGAIQIFAWLPMYLEGRTWVRPAVRAGLESIEKHQINAIWSTALPPAAHIIAYRLAQRTGLPLILDYRDLWSLNPYVQPKLGLSRWLDRRLERKILQEADGVITVSEGMGQKLQSLNGKKLDIQTIPTGYDPADLPKSRAWFQPNLITHVGSLCGKRTQTAARFIDGLAEFEMVEPERAAELTVRLVGKIDPQVLRLAGERLSLVQVEHLEPVNHNEAMRMMSESGVLLLLTELEEMGSAPGRVYEYLAAGRPIMSVGAACEISSLLAGLPDCLIVDGSDPGQIMQALVNLLNQDEEPTSLEGRQSLLRQYTFRELSGKLAGLLNKIVMP